ncbi:MAG: TIGR04255 family protein [Frankiales bacterium]|nr:TIGR04255 family protein [Frankiales bacterium]
MVDVLVTGTDEFDKPLGALVGVSRLRLERTHMEAAVAEVRFVPGREELSEADAIHVWNGLGKASLPVFERHTMNTVNLTVTPSGADHSTQVQHGWVLATNDRRTAVTLLPSMVVVQTSAYDHYSTSLGNPLTEALRLFVEATGAAVVQRIGLRYINRLQDAEAVAPVFWQDHVRPAFAGPLVGETAALVEALHQQVQLQLDATAGARVQSGVFREQGVESRYSFLVDLDVYREQALDFDETLIANMTRQLNRTALALFAQVLSEKYWAELGPVPVEGVAR